MTIYQVVMSYNLIISLFRLVISINVWITKFYLFRQKIFTNCDMNMTNCDIDMTSQFLLYKFISPLFYLLPVALCMVGGPSPSIDKLILVDHSVISISWVDWEGGDLIIGPPIIMYNQ